VIVHEVLTAEKVRLTYRVAGLGSRFLAWVCDFLIMGMLIFAGIWMFAVVDLGVKGIGSALVTLWIFAVQWGYFLFFEWLWQGQTPGKRAVGIRVLQWNGTAINFVQSAVRNLVRTADFLPVANLVGFLVALTNRENRRLGDLAAGTLVVYVEHKAKLIVAVQEGAVEVDKTRLALVRQRLGQLDREQKQTLVELSLRRDQLRFVERARLFKASAGFLRARLDLLPEAYESDEKFVLRLTSVLADGAAGANPDIGSRAAKPLSPRTRGERGDNSPSSAGRPCG
jgi:uncharacterized RDD family membrane protein YckC